MHPSQSIAHRPPPTAHRPPPSPPPTIDRMANIYELWGLAEEGPDPDSRFHRDLFFDQTDAIGGCLPGPQHEVGDSTERVVFNTMLNLCEPKKRPKKRPHEPKEEPKKRSHEPTEQSSQQQERHLEFIQKRMSDQADVIGCTSGIHRYVSDVVASPMEPPKQTMTCEICQKEFQSWCPLRLHLLTHRKYHHMKEVSCLSTFHVNSPNGTCGKRVLISALGRHHKTFHARVAKGIRRRREDVNMLPPAKRAAHCSAEIDASNTQ